MANRQIRYIDIDQLENEVRTDYLVRIMSDDTSGYETVLLESIAELKAAREVVEEAKRVVTSGGLNYLIELEDALKNLDTTVSKTKHRKLVDEYEKSVREISSGIFGYGNKK